MKTIKLLVFAIALTIGFTACNKKAINIDDLKLKNDADTVSVLLGYSIGENLKNEFEGVDPELLNAAIIDAFKGNENKLIENPQEADMFIRSYMRKLSELKAQKNIKAGQDFLDKNAKRKGVVVTETGLQYEVMVEGSGVKPSIESTVEVHYHGTTIDGTVFESSVESGETVVFPLTGVISGWTEGLQLMNVGSKYKFFIPSDLAYGPRGGGPIGPNSTLVFEVELISIVE
jgi:FKBP-type peptidyl-prolyl cis-trans isomerase